MLNAALANAAFQCCARKVGKNLHVGGAASKINPKSLGLVFYYFHSAAVREWTPLSIEVIFNLRKLFLFPEVIFKSPPNIHGKKTNNGKFKGYF